MSSSQVSISFYQGRWSLTSYSNSNIQAITMNRRGQFQTAPADETVAEDALGEDFMDESAPSSPPLTQCQCSFLRVGLLNLLS